MDKNANPLDYLIRCCEQGLIPHNFDILNAKDELKKLRDNVSRFELVGWSRINNRGDVYDMRICHNPYIEEDTVLPIYSNREEYKAKYDKLSK